MLATAQTKKSSPSAPVRMLLFLGIFALSAIAPWWIGVVVAAVLLIFYNAYEIVLIGIFIDSLYSAPGAHVWGVELPATLLLLTGALLAPLLKRNILFYS